MGKPTDTELGQAIQAAIVMRENGNDPDFVAKSLLSLNYRMQKMERLLTATKRFLHAGQSSTDHRALLQVLAAAEKANADDSDPDFSSGR
ncbi:MAG: hypothetical protein Q8J78_10865 [Moraxellaceae bacterium]|nr:hypothetical protein [Moraxellaceae bacterium]